MCNNFKAIDLCICKYSKHECIRLRVACYREHVVCTPVSGAFNLLKYHGIYVNISMENGRHTSYYPSFFIARLFWSQGRTFLRAFVFHHAFTSVTTPVTHIAVCCRLLYALRGEREASCSNPNPRINMMQPQNLSPCCLWHWMGKLLHTKLRGCERFGWQWNPACKASGEAPVWI